MQIFYDEPYRFEKRKLSSASYNYKQARNQ